MQKSQFKDQSYSCSWFLDGVACFKWPSQVLEFETSSFWTELRPNISWVFSGQVLTTGRREAGLPRTLVGAKRMLQGQTPTADLGKIRTWASAQAAQCSRFPDLGHTGSAGFLGHCCHEGLAGLNDFPGILSWH